MRGTVDAPKRRNGRAAAGTRAAVAGLAVLTAFAAPSPRPAGAQSVELGGQIRPRFEARLFDGFDLTDAAELTTMRTRLAMTAVLRPDVRAFVQMQDVRAWGSEASTTDGQADMLDLHQGWIEFGDPAGAGPAFRAGRQELAYGEERLIGALDWAQQARSFDGLRLRIHPGTTATVDLLAMRLGEADAGTVDAALYGAYATLPAVADLDVYGLYNTVGDDDTDQITVGARWASSWSRSGAAPGAATEASIGAGIDWRLEAAYQGGRRAQTDVSAFLLAARLGAPLSDDLRADLWYDYLSGDDDITDGDTGAFSTLFATNHKFYGFMDLFLDVPLATNNRGLQDLALKATYRLSEATTLQADLHAFLLADATGLNSGRLGEELDVVITGSLGQGLGLSGGAAYFRAGDGWDGPFDTMTWFYLMLTASW